MNLESYFAETVYLRMPTEVNENSYECSLQSSPETF